jgi:hypothetical protein
MNRIIRAAAALLTCAAALMSPPARAGQPDADRVRSALRAVENINRSMFIDAVTTFVRAECHSPEREPCSPSR